MPCPICKKPTETAFRPFCSKRCADIDLGKWFSGSYAIPAAASEDDENLENELKAASEKKPH
ncbi:DNA gyrase inhibitor YacG [Loktanella sp. D2R18]|uniref:DNA gyrase inhibitor YacG n=1 Tax=Rhodobacterales TaxID=204455 RepID=UPI000DEA1099|nr:MULTISPECIES: DNA gyrase inhibitor YacG [Rhodobacterales]MDO6591648.1 DNA gyrase inhibitor YacG [Yoonia sp. 1_MG-2023]RBW42486.1 DNA gyrase inhibitor YacG [Loktanella sp. D2R18]